MVSERDYVVDVDDEDAAIPADQQEDESDLPRDKMGDPSQAVMFTNDWTAATIVQQIDKGNIDLNPEFQRRSAWDPDRRSKLIESLAIGLPVPNVVLAEAKEKRGRFIVIDGKQRLTTLADFMSENSVNKFSLRSLTIRDDLNGLTWDQMREHKREDADFLENAPLRTVVIRAWPSDYFLYVIFDRLNSGSLPLSPQELRRALQPGPMLDHVDVFIANSSAVKSALGLTKPDRRMRDSEIVLRYIAIEKNYPNYDGDFKAFLDSPVRWYNSDWSSRHQELDQLLSKLEIAVRISEQIFGSGELYRKWNGQRFERRINRAIFDAITRYFGDPTLEAIAVERKAEIVDALKNLCSTNVEFKRAIELTTKHP